MYDPEQYDAFKKLSYRSFNENPVSKLMSGMNWDMNEVILDYGCGTGTMTNKRLAPIASEYNSAIHCLDISDKMIEYAKKKYPNPRIHYQVGNIMSEKFPFTEETFDKIFAIHVLNWLSDFKVGLRRFYNIMKPGGYFGFLVGSGGFLQNKLLHAIAQDPKWATYMRGYDEFKHMNMYDDPELVEESYRDGLREVGFEIYDLKTIKEGKDPVSIHRLVGFYVSLNPYLPRIPKSLRKDLENCYSKYIYQFLNKSSDLDSELSPANKALEEELVEHEHTILFVIAQKPL